MFHGTICDGKKGPAVFWEKEWGSMDSRKYNEVILSTIGEWFENARAQGIRLAWPGNTMELLVTDSLRPKITYIDVICR
jgi:hypothetical protein